MSDKRTGCAFTSMLNEVDKRQLRQLQVEMHRCTARCCQSRGSSAELVHECVARCSEGLKRFHKAGKKQFFHLQKRFQGCALACNNEAREQKSRRPLTNLTQLYGSDFDECLFKCVDSNFALIPLIMKKMREILSSNSPEAQNKTN